MRITAIFEQWYIGDGTYPPLRKRQLVNVAFELHPQRLYLCEGRAPSLRHAGNAEYEFTGLVLRHYGGDDPVLLIDVDGFRFYVSDGAVPFENFQQGQQVSGQGTLALDHYLWAEFGHEYEPDPPNLFYTLRVERITEVQIPMNYITRSATGWAAPTWVHASDVHNRREVEHMDDQEWEIGFYVVEYDGFARHIPKANCVCNLSVLRSASR